MKLARYTTILVAALLSALALSPAVAVAADWLQFRGSFGNGVAHDSQVPTEWDDERHIAWKAPLPGKGPASPIVVGENIVVTSSSGPQQEMLHVLCLDALTGEKRWERRFWATGRTLCHPTSANAAPTPASDGELIFAFFSSNDLVCLDLEGNLKWFRGLAYDYPKAGNDIGMASSPLVIGDTVVVQVENQGNSFAEGLDRETGLTKWHLDREPVSNWSSPMALRGASPEEDLVVLQSPDGVSTHDADTGEEFWKFDGECSSVPSLVCEQGVLYVPSQGMMALRPASEGGETDILWQASVAPGNASPLIFQDSLFVLNRGGVLTSSNAASGDVQWRLRLGGTFWASPVVAGSHLYFVNQEGKVFIVSTGGSEGEIVSEYELGETVLASPAVGDDALYIRSNGHLWKIAEPSAES